MNDCQDCKHYNNKSETYHKIYHAKKTKPPAKTFSFHLATAISVPSMSIYLDE